MNTHPIQYFAPLYAYLNQSEELSVTGLYLSDYSVRGSRDRAFGQTVKWDIDLLGGYDARFVAGASRREEPRGFLSMLAPELWGELRGSRFDALVVHGHTPAAYLIGIAAAKRSGMRLFMRIETHLGLSRPTLKRALRRFIGNALYRSCHGVLAIGSANAAFYRAMGVPDSRIFSMPYAVDNSRFIGESRMTEPERRELRSALGVYDERPIVLYAGKFQTRKRAHDLIRAAALLNRDGVVFHLAMVGSGEVESELRALSRELNMQNVHFHGFVNQSGLPRIYAACDVFVLPSVDEPWGLAVNEAMCAGLPIVASAEVGCAPDLISEGRNGRTFDGGDIAGLAQTLRPLLVDAEMRRDFGRASRDIIARWSYAECLDGLRTALASVGLDRFRDGRGQQTQPAEPTRP